MTRFLIALAASALVVGLVGLLQTAPTQAQQGGPPVCLNLDAGEHSFTAPARDREGEVTFRVTVGDGGMITEFTEPGGQSIPPAAFLQIFAGEDAYPLPEGVEIVECEDAGDSMMEDPSKAVCLNLPAGRHETTVNISGEAQPLVLDIGEGGVVRGLNVLGSNYTGHQGLALMRQFGVSLPAGIQIIDCAAPADSMMEDEPQPELHEDEEPQPTLYANTGTGGLADTSGSNAVFYAITAVAALLFGGLAIRRRASVAAKRD